MSRQSTSSDNNLPPRLGDQIDILCDWFEAELQKGNTPKIEDLLPSVVESGRSQLLRELIAVEVAVTRQRGQSVDFQAYFARFPNDVDALNQLRVEIENPGLHSATTRSASEGVGRDTVSMDCVDPTRAKHFELQAIAGIGGFGTVWRAFDTKLQREVAVKIPRQDRIAKADLSVVLREAQAAAKLRHSNIVTVYQVAEGDENQPPFIVTDFIDGPNLKTWLETHQMLPRQTAALVGKVARALAHAHSRGITHCDVKPGNVLLDSGGEPHLADFGLAKRLVTNEAATGKRRVGGTLPYMSPEQACSRPELDYRTDIYSLGVMLYELLTGQRPFLGDPDSVFDQINNAAPKPPRNIKPAIPADLEQICLKCIAKSPADRYQTAEALADDLQRWLNGESPRGVSISIPNRTMKWAKRHRRFVISLATTAAICLSLAAGIWWWNRPPDLRRLVEFETDPPGCEITVVKIDPATGDPDPARIERSRDKTPLKMRLLPGDYLVVAVQDAHRFHEVIRHVPTSKERALSMAYRHTYWKLDSNGCIHFLEKIQIWESDAIPGMGVIAGNKSWVSPEDPMVSESTSPRWNVPSFAVDLQDQTAKQDALSDKTFTTSDFDRAMEYAECMGKRLPTSMELLFVSDNARQSALGNTDGRQQTIDGQPIFGLEEEPWEWTTTKQLDEEENTEVLRITRCGAPPLDNKGQLVFRVQLQKQRWQINPTLGVRCVRSLNPRRQAADFIRPAQNPPQ